MARSLQRLCTLYTAIILSIPSRSSARNQFSFSGFIKFYGHISPAYTGCFNLSFFLHKSILSLDVNLLCGFPSATLEKTHTRCWRFCPSRHRLVLLHLQLVRQTDWGWFRWHTQSIVDAGSSYKLKPCDDWELLLKRAQKKNSQLSSFMPHLLLLCSFLVDEHSQTLASANSAFKDTVEADVHGCRKGQCGSSEALILSWLVTTQFSSSLGQDTSTLPANLAAPPLPTSVAVQTVHLLVSSPPSPPFLILFLPLPLSWWLITLPAALVLLM